MASGLYPVIQAFNLGGALVNEFEISDPRFALRAESNRAKADQPRPRGPARDTSIFGYGLNRRIAVLDGRLVLNVHLDAPGIEFLEVDTDGKSSCSYYLAAEETMSVMDFVIIRQGDGPLFTCIANREGRGLLILKPAGK